MFKLLISFIDFFYFIFKRFIPLKTYRYAICGGGNMLFDLVLYFLFFHFVLCKQDVDLYFIVLSPHIASLFFVFPITFTSGFVLNKFITFQDSNLSGKTQFIRYLLVAIGAIVLSYISMKILVDIMGFYPTLSRLLTMFISVIYSYLLQSRFSFGKVK
jgi:putative flippase GtrA